MNKYQKMKEKNFLDACERNDLKETRYWVKNNANIHAYNDIAFRWACRDGHINIVKLLVKKGADIHADNDQGFWWACKRGHTEIIKLLEKHMGKNNE